MNAMAWMDIFLRSLLIAPFFFVNGALAIKVYLWNKKRVDTKFLRALRIENPESVITLVAVESSDSEAIDNIKEQLREYQRRGQ